MSENKWWRDELELQKGNRSPEQGVKEVLKESMPDVRQETSGQNEQGEAEKEAINQVSESIVSIRRELQNTESFDNTRQALQRLEEILPSRSRRFQELEEISSQTRSFQAQFDEVESLCSKLASVAEGADIKDVIREVEALQTQLDELKSRAYANQQNIEDWATTLGRWASDSEDVMGYDTADEVRSMMRRMLDAAEEAFMQARRVASRLEEPLEGLRRITSQQ